MLINPHDEALYTPSKNEILSLKANRPWNQEEGALSLRWCSLPLDRPGLDTACFQGRADQPLQGLACCSCGCVDRFEDHHLDITKTPIIYLLKEVSSRQKFRCLLHGIAHWWVNELDIINGGCYDFAPFQRAMHLLYPWWQAFHKTLIDTTGLTAAALQMALMDKRAD